MYECRCCNGKGVVIKEDIKILTPCRKCGGVGSLDWINNVRNNRIDISFDQYKSVTMRNIQMLTQYLNHLCVEIGYTCEVAFRQSNHPDYYPPLKFDISEYPRLYERTK